MCENWARSDDFASIRYSPNAIEVTENPSEITIAIALLFAELSLNHQPLVLQGSSVFKKVALKSAIQYKFPISFAYKLTQIVFLLLKEALALERKNFVANAGSIFSKQSERTKLALSTANQIFQRIQVIKALSSPKSRVHQSRKSFCRAWRLYLPLSSLA